ncbi:hypothetical protein niasHT_003314 [Heterodera trifolii]|uniref:MATH domain-containing protein n=1 Tax=Heterodera trifolii TaxID=157864 RepID=A0ABD2LXU9_9BILA
MSLRQCSCLTPRKNKEKTSVNCPAVVEIPDIEPAAFKVMLSFIYADDLSGLNGDNAIVLYTAKKYNIPDLADRSLQIPISKLRNVFMAYAQALIFELEDFASKCLRYICQNAKMLCNLLDRDRLLLSNEFEIWNAALRWADEKCRQNGIERSSGNRRSFLGPALFKIRFPNIHEEQFSICVVPSGLLTMEEVLGIYQFNSHPNLFFRGVPGLYSLKFPSHGRIFNWNIAKGNRRGTLVLEIEKVLEFAGESVGSRRRSDAVLINGLAWKIEKVSEFLREIIGSERKSETVHIKGFPWKIWAQIEKKNESTDNKKWLAFYLLCDASEEVANVRQLFELFLKKWHAGL